MGLWSVSSWDTLNVAHRMSNSSSLAAATTTIAKIQNTGNFDMFLYWLKIKRIGELYSYKYLEKFREHLCRGMSSGLFGPCAKINFFLIICND